MRKKRFLIVLTAILLFAALSFSVHGGCCVADDLCSIGVDDTWCTGTQAYFPSACQQIASCEIGCCCKPTDSSINGMVFIRSNCEGIAGAWFEYMGPWDPTPSEYISVCEVTCGATDIACDTDYVCPDGTVVATCVDGNYIFTGDTCPTPTGEPVDTDGDGTADEYEECPNEPALTDPAETAETTCDDGIDNDCDNLKDCNDLDCCADAVCSDSPSCIIVTCGDGVVDAVEECDDGDTLSGDGCSNICRIEDCGDGIIHPALGEECDYGDLPDAGWAGFNCYEPGTTDIPATEDVVEKECTFTGVVLPGVANECNNAVDDDNDICIDWPFDKECLIEDDEDEENIVSGCRECGDDILDTPNSWGFNEDCESDSDCGSIEGVDGSCNDCTCSYTCLEDPGTPTEHDEFIVPVKGEFANLVKWQINPSGGCGLEKIYVYRCSNPLGGPAECVPDELIVENESEYPDVFYSHKDEPVSADTRYCYRIDAYYTTGAVARSDVECITTGDANCMANEEGQFCKDNIRYKCDNENFVQMILQNCSEMSTDDPDGFVCVGPRADGSTECYYQSECDLCNGLFGLFSIGTAANPIAYQGLPLLNPETTGDYYCYNIPTCYNDSTRTTINKYHSCIDITTCYDYRSEGACAENKCELGECEWSSSEKAFQELGVGVCRPVKKELQNCSICGTFKTTAQNLFYGDCDIEVCKLYGECYYSYEKCGSKEESGCWSYTTEEDCIYADKTKSLAAAKVNVAWGGVEDGDESPIRYVFVTESTYTGDLKTAATGLGYIVDTGLEGADAICQHEADTAGLPGTYRAWLSDSGTDARDRIVHSSFPYKLADTDKTLIADDWDDLMTALYLDAPINKDASGEDVSATKIVWTGTRPDGTLYDSTMTCGDWTSDSGSEIGRCGDNTKKDDLWTSNLDMACSSSNIHLYCFQQDVSTGHMRKINGDNTIKQESNDYLNFGLCKWIQYEGLRADVPPYICIKDADNSTVPDCEYGEENKACQTDNTAPETIFILDEHPMYDSDGDTVYERILLPQKIDLKYQTSEKAEVYFCIVTEGGSCYPDETSMCSIQTTFDGATGDYRLYYFAEDRSHNLEEVSFLPVRINVDYPVITADADVIDGSSAPPNDYKITLSSDKPVKCSGRLMKGNGVPTMHGNVLEFEIDNDFTREYYDLPDNRYYFDYECRDYAGNVVKDKVWFSVDTNRIHNPGPFGPQDSTGVIISVETEGDAACRYARYTGHIPGYESMTNFAPGTDSDDNGNFTHTASPSVMAKEYYEYVVKCKFGGIEEGNENDRIRFSIDTEGPSVYPVTTFEAYGFDVSKTWGANQYIKLQCRDDYFEQVKKVFNMDFGCEDKILYRYESDDFAELALDDDGLSRDDIFIEGSRTHIIEYIANDSDDAGNIVNTETGDITIIIDNDAPEMDITVYPYPMGPGSPELDSISYGNYVVKVTSTKSLHDMNISLVVDSNDMHLGYMYSEDFGKKYYFLLRIPYPEEPGGLARGSSYTGTIVVTGLVKMPGSVCSLDKIDDEALIGTGGKTIEINTQNPEIEIKPELDDFEGAGYPLREVGNVYYTNESRLFITGERKNTGVSEVWFYVLNGDDITVDRASPQKIYTYNDANNAPVEPLNLLPLSVVYFTLGDEGKEGSRILDIMQNIFLDDENYIEIIGKERERYGNYRKYYNIDWVTDNNDGTRKITLVDEDPLETDLSSADTVNVYPAPHPNEWFGEYIELEPGNNTFYARPRSASGIMPLPENLYIIFADPNPPIVISQIPKKGTTNNIYTPISIVVSEAARESLLDISSVKLTLNGVEITEPDLTITVYNISSFIYYEITYQPPEPLEDGTYNVLFEGHDNAGHGLTNSTQASYAWAFEVDTLAPSTPIFEIENGTFFNGVWYVNRSPGFSLEFADEDPVNISAIYEEKPEGGFRKGHDCDDSENRYNCTFDPALEPLQFEGPSWIIVDDTFQIIVEAYKNLADKQESPRGLYYLDPIVIDNITPSISNLMYPKRVKVDGEVIIKVYLGNEFHDLNATLIPPNVCEPMPCIYTNNYPLEQINHIGSLYEFKWYTPDYGTSAGPPEVNHNFTLMIADYAGNYNTTNVNVTVDLQIPDINSMRVSVRPAMELPEEYRTRYTIIIVNGTFVDDDIESIFIIPGSYVPSQQEWEEVSQSAILYDHSFIVEMEINGTIDETTLNYMNLFLADKAGYQRSRLLSVIADLEPPTVITSAVS